MGERVRESRMTNHRSEQENQCQGCLSRRDFLSRAAGAAAIVAATAACGDGVISAPFSDRPRGPGPWSVTIGEFPELASIGGIVEAWPAIAVKRTGVVPDTFVAYDMTCTHLGCTTNLQTQVFVCPCHGSRFDSSGAVVRGPAAFPLGVFQTSYDAVTDTLTITN